MVEVKNFQLIVDTFLQIRHTEAVSLTLCQKTEDPICLSVGGGEVKHAFVASSEVAETRGERRSLEEVTVLALCIFLHIRTEGSSKAR